MGKDSEISRWTPELRHKTLQSRLQKQKVSIDSDPQQEPLHSHPDDDTRSQKGIVGDVRFWIRK